MSKKVLNFVEEKREAPNFFNSDASPPCKNIDWVSVSPLALKEKGIVPCQNDLQPSNNAIHMGTSEMCATDTNLITVFLLINLHLLDLTPSVFKEI